MHVFLNHQTGEVMFRHGKKNHHMRRDSPHVPEFWLRAHRLLEKYKDRHINGNRRNGQDAGLFPDETVKVFIEGKERTGIWRTNPDGSSGGFVEEKCSVGKEAYLDGKSTVIDGAIVIGGLRAYASLVKKSIVFQSLLVSSRVEDSIVTISTLEKSTAIRSRIGGNSRLDTCRIEESELNGKLLSSANIVNNKPPYTDMLAWFEAHLLEIQ